MKVVILAGGFGTRISEESHLRPKPMIEIGGKPILWHIMKIFSYHGFNEFIICCGYKGHLIKEYFANYFLYNSDITFDLKSNKRIIHDNFSDPWKVTVVDTGVETMTGGRIKRIDHYINEGEDFFLTYGDGVSDIDLTSVLLFHRKHKKLATVTAVQPPGRFGQLVLKENMVEKFIEKPDGDGGYINGGFFILNKRIMNYIEDDFTIWEKNPLSNLANDGELLAYTHNGFWQPMDTLRDKVLLEKLWNDQLAPWKVWKT